jgi:hypothetical protein
MGFLLSVEINPSPGCYKLPHGGGSQESLVHLGLTHGANSKKIFRGQADAICVGESK